MKKITIAVLLIVSTAAIAALNQMDSKLTSQVKSGELTLECHFSDGHRIVPPAKVKYFSEGRWIFTNGSSSNCEVY